MVPLLRTSQWHIHTQTQTQSSNTCSVFVMRLEALESALLSLTYCWCSGLIKILQGSDKNQEEDRKTRLAVLSDKDTVQTPDDFNMSLEWHLSTLVDHFNKENRCEQAKSLCLWLQKWTECFCFFTYYKTPSWHLYWAFWKQNQI